VVTHPLTGMEKKRDRENDRDIHRQTDRQTDLCDAGQASLCLHEASSADCPKSLTVMLAPQTTTMQTSPIILTTYADRNHQ